MSGDQPHGYEEAARAISANVSPRYLRLQALESWVTCEQYAGRPDWWTGGQDRKPRWERSPCFVYPVTQIAIGSNTDLVFGEGRFPAIVPDKDEESGLGETDAEKLASFIAQYHKQSRFKAHCREAFDAAQGCGTAVAIHGHRNGRPFADLLPAKWCEPKLDNERRVLELEVRYPYLHEFKVDGKWTVQAKLYRRLITATDDITFYPADAREDGTEPSWQPDPAQSIQHNLGFCPVVWYPFMRGCAAVNVIDGHAIHERLTDEIQQFDLAVSTAQTCMLHSQPQPVETGVSPGYNPTAEEGRTAIVPSTERGGALGDPGKPTGAYLYGQPQPARPMGPGHMWSYTDPNTKVSYLAFPSGLLKEQEEHCHFLLDKIEHGLAVVLPKPSQFKFAGAVSGKSLEETKKRQFDRCDQYRDDLEDGFLTPSVSMQLRIAQRVGKHLKVPGIADVLPILERFATDAVASA